MKIITLLTTVCLSTNLYVQIPIENINAFPPVISISCGDCDPAAQGAVEQEVYEGAKINYKTCFSTGYNDLNQPASEENCSTGQVLVTGANNNVSLYFYMVRDGLMVYRHIAYHYRPGDITNNY